MLYSVMRDFTLVVLVCVCVCTCQTIHMYWIFASTCIYLYFTKTDRVYTPSTRI